ncbi:uncharacterized protein G2W53_039471 [Senna tora]|uniref:Helitron helicase-like domain-containing protein n=1 Tax=Senna tora TaxID=362788 RepID=A0A834SMJ8_9FABA|nr:uncharacterized protein G2W53_039471 [Senna tora]
MVTFQAAIYCKSMPVGIYKYISGNLGICIWKNVSDLHKTYVIWRCVQVDRGKSKRRRQLNLDRAKADMEIDVDAELDEKRWQRMKVLASRRVSNNNVHRRERVCKSKKSMHPKFSMCCMQAKVVLPPVKRPKLLDDLFSMKDPMSANFMKEIRNYNNMFAFSSMGGKIDYTVNNGKGPYLFRLHVKERCKSSNANNLRLRLVRKSHSDARTYNLPTASEVAALIVGGFSLDKGEHDIIVENRSGLLERIEELHPLYLPIQYPLLFPYGEDGYREETLYRDGAISADRKHRTLTLRQ